MQNENVELLPCPWCLGPARLTEIKGSPTNPFLVSCDGVASCPMTLAMTPEEWNARALIPVSTAPGEVCRCEHSESEHHRSQIKAFYFCEVQGCGCSFYRPASPLTVPKICNGLGVVTRLPVEDK